MPKTPPKPHSCVDYRIRVKGTRKYQSDGETVSLAHADKFDTRKEALTEVSTYDSDFRDTLEVVDCTTVVNEPQSKHRTR